MKKYFLFLLIIIVVIADLFISNTIISNNNINKTFDNSGYILKYTDSSERYYFEQEATYKKSYNDQIVFKDTEGEKVVIDKNNFIHYDDGSLASFTKGVLIDLDMIDTEPITYYNISANKVLQKLSNDKYVTKNLDKEIQFTNLMWKISDSKYLVASNSMQIVFGDGTEKDINGFVEIEYSDNEIVKIFNQEVKYETISYDVYLRVNENIKINLGNKIVSKNNENEMTLENMVIDSNDNVTIIDMEEYKEENTEENTTTNETDSTVQGGNAGATSGGSINANGGTTIIGGSTTEDGDNDEEGTDNEENNGGSNIETEIQDDLSVNAPKYTIKQFEVTSTGLQAVVEIEDDEARLTTGTTTTILNNATAKAVYTLPETGATEIRVDTSSLEPNTEYTLVMEATYAIDEVEYKKNFVYKIFRTPVFGIILEKDLFTDESLAFNIKFEENSPVTKLDVELVENGQVREEILNNAGSTEKVTFVELTPDTEYTIRIKNIYVDNVSNTNTYEYKFKTLKSTPKLANGKTHADINTEVDKWNSKFVLRIPDLQEGTVETLNYQIFTQTEGQETLVYSKITTDTELTLPINDIIQRNQEYYCKVYATFYDNEKTVEYEIASTETSFIMNSSEMPTISFEKSDEDSITFNSIKGNIVIEDVGNTINTKTTKVEVIYGSTSKDVDDNGTITYNGIGEDLKIPIDLNELKSNETYKFSVYATYDLHDENGERYGYIGSILITTKKPVPMKANWEPGDEGIEIKLSLTSTEDSDIEAASLYSFELALYAGQEGASNTPIATTKLVDNGVESFAGSLGATYYTEEGAMITADTFGLTEAQVAEIEKDNTFCTIVLTNAKDYVSRNLSKNFENDLPIISNSMSYQISTTSLRNPVNISDAVQIKNRTKLNLKNMTDEELSKLNIITTKDYNSVEEIINNDKMNDSTIAAIEVKANISNSQLDKFNYFEYFVYNSKGVVLAQTELIEKTAEMDYVPTALFLISNGITNEEKSSDIVRGSTYYIKYYAYETKDKEGKYPIDVNGKDYWNTASSDELRPLTKINKQEPNIIMYPSTSDADSISYKYKVSDIDNTIYVIKGKKYFNYLYADVDLTLINPKEIMEGENSEDENGYWTVKFDDLSQYYTNYDLEISIKKSLYGIAEERYKKEELTVQELEEIIEAPDITINIEEDEEGASSLITFNNLTAVYREEIQKIKVQFIDRDNEIEPIEIEKSSQQLNWSNWRIEINYIEDIINQVEENIKGKTFDINVTIYYINGQVGYDNGDDAVTYETANEELLKINSDGAFTKKETTYYNIQYPVIYESHKYYFEKDNMLINKDEESGEAESYLNYSQNGFTRIVDGESDVVIIPKKVVSYDLEKVGEFKVENILSGIRSWPDLDYVPGPSYVEITLDNIYDKDTIGEGQKIWLQLYSKKDENNKMRSPMEVTLGTPLLIENLKSGVTYYYKLYVEVDGTKYYVYDINDDVVGQFYSFKTLDSVKISDIQVSYTANSKDSKRIRIRHFSSINRGFKGFTYEICDSEGNLITDNISYSTNNANFETTNTGTFTIDLQSSSYYHYVYVDVNRNTFFEYDTNYIIKITPIIEIDGVIETIGDTESKTYSYTPTPPEMLVYTRRVENINGLPYIEFSTSVADDDFLIANDTINYKIYKGDNKTSPVLQGSVSASKNNVITVNKEKIGDTFVFESAYTIEVSYEYYKSNISEEPREARTITKELTAVENGIFIGTVNWSIETTENQYGREYDQIRLKFYDSYRLDKIKSIKCSIYDTDGMIVKNVPTISDIEILDQTSSTDDPHKSICFNPSYTFTKDKGYIISIRFLDENGNEIASYESDGPVTKQ